MFLLMSVGVNDSDMEVNSAIHWDKMLLTLFQTNFATLHHENNGANKDI